MNLHIIAGQFKGRALRAPKTSFTRPTQGMLRESVFNICQNAIQEASFLDLFAGSGAMGLEALSRGAKHATFVESDRNASASIRENIAILQVASQTTLLSCDARIAIQRLSTPFDIIYIDPPYETSALPFVAMLLERSLLAKSGFLFLEEQSRSSHSSPQFPPLVWINSRRFGDALLHQYRSSDTKTL